MTNTTLMASNTLSSRMLRALRRLGPLGFVNLCIYNLKLILSGEYRDHRYVYDRSFDQQYGVDTAGTVAVQDLDAPAELKARAKRYEAAEPDFVNFLIDRIGVASRADYLFIDVGAGKGRVMLLAALAGFRRVIGVELDPALASAARENIERFGSQHRDTSFDLVEADATSFAFPPVATVLFFNNPFDAQLIDRTLAGLERAHASAKSDVVLIYMHSLHADVIRARGWEELDRGVFRTGRQFYSILRWRQPEIER
jgi:predicted RNA methylase